MRTALPKLADKTFHHDRPQKSNLQHPEKNIPIFAAAIHNLFTKLVAIYPKTPDID